VKARYKGLLKNDNQLAMLFTLANLFRVDQMIRQGRDLSKNRK
ncbi:IS5 family transposase, partial [Escherichia coli]